MWRTPNGDRTLKGAEATLVRELIAQVVVWLEAEASGELDRWPTSSDQSGLEVGPV